jgi:hypothetical protein
MTILLLLVYLLRCVQVGFILHHFENFITEKDWFWLRRNFLFTTTATATNKMKVF